MEYMSAEHMAAMNELLQSAPEVRAACDQLGESRVMSYLLTNGPDHEDVHWTITFTDTIRFSPEEAAAPDLRFTGDWRQMIRSARAGREGKQIDPGVAIDGDPAICAAILTAFESARGIATLPVEFPTV